MLTEIQGWFVDFYMLLATALAVVVNLILLVRVRGLTVRALSSKVSTHLWLAVIVFSLHLVGRYGWPIDAPKPYITWYAFYGALDALAIGLVYLKVRLLGIVIWRDHAVALLSFAGGCTQVLRMMARFHDEVPFSSGAYSVFSIVVNIGLIVVLFSFPLSIAMQVRRARVGRPERSEEKRDEVKNGDFQVSGHL